MYNQLSLLISKIDYLSNTLNISKMQSNKDLELIYRSFVNVGIVTGIYLAIGTRLVPDYCRICKLFEIILPLSYYLKFWCSL